MKSTKILLIESARKNGTVFAASLQRKYDVQVAASGKQGLEAAGTMPPDIVILNAESLRTSGDRILARLREQLGELPIIHIRPEKISAKESPADIVLVPPFTARKLINRIERFVPAAEDEVLEVGPFSLRVDQQTLITPWSERKLTPKLVELLRLFLENQDVTLEREQIIRTVWKTEYMGDTRTLDVHIRWLRKVVEPEPRKPRFITTVRGVGYCFHLPEDNPKSPSKSGKQAQTQNGVSETAAPESNGASGESGTDPDTHPKIEIKTPEMSANGGSALTGKAVQLENPSAQLDTSAPLD